MNLNGRARVPRSVTAGALGGTTPAGGLARYAWMVLGGMALLVPLVFVLLPRGGPGQSWILILANAIGAGAVILGPRLHRSPDRLPWRLIGLGLLTWVLANVVAFADRFLGQPGIGFPSPSDGFYLAAPVFLAWGIALIVRRQTGGAKGFALLDTAIIALGGCLLSWTFILRPLVDAPGFPLLMRATALAYPITDLLLLAMATCLLVTPAFRIRSYRLLVGALVVQILADTVYAIRSQMGTFEPGGLLDAGWPVAILLIAMAAAHPSMRELTSSVSHTASSGSGLRLLPLVGAALVAPVTIAATGFGGGRLDATVLASGGAMFLLVFLRMRRLLQLVEVAQSERGRILERVFGAAEQERIRLAGEMHDGPVQRLTALSFRLELAKKRLRRGDVGAADRDIERIQKRFEEEIHALRALMSGLRPPALDEKGLAAALTDEAERFRSDTGVETVAEIELDGRLDGEVEAVFYRAAQEALTNVAKHARASRVWVTIDRSGGEARLRVRDDGIGFSPEDLTGRRSGEHFGLLAMRERIGLVGGCLDVRSSPGEGTTLEVRLPATPLAVAGAAAS